MAVASPNSQSGDLAGVIQTRQSPAIFQRIVHTFENNELEF